MTVETLSTPYSVVVQHNNIMVNGCEEFAILQKRPDLKGYQSIIFSISITPDDVLSIKKSGIAQVVSFSESGTILFRRKDLYEHTKMYELIIDILNRYEEKEIRKHLA